MWAKLVVDKLLRKSMRSNDFVTDLPPEFPGRLDDSRESSSSSAPVERSTDQETLKIFVNSWNVGGVAPPKDDMDMEGWLDISKNTADIYVFGFQEIVPLSAGNILGYRDLEISLKWNMIIRSSLEKTLPSTTKDRDSVAEDHSRDFRCVISKQMVGIFISVWARTDLCKHIQHPNISCIGCGIMGCFGNKGSVSVRFLLRGTSFCFVCSHLAAGGREGDERHRNSDAARILLRSSFPPGPLRNLPRQILDHDRVIWLGDLNYRIHLPESTTRSLVERRRWSVLLESDQLKAELVEGRVFQGWQEGAIEFAPTYKYYPNSGVYYGSCDDEARKGRRFQAPAWCDRIIWVGEGLKQSQYDRGESRLSDHRPVRAMFSAEVEHVPDSSRFESFDCFKCFKPSMTALSDEFG